MRLCTVAGRACSAARAKNRADPSHASRKAFSGMVGLDPVVDPEQHVADQQEQERQHHQQPWGGAALHQHQCAHGDRDKVDQPDGQDEGQVGSGDVLGASEEAGGQRVGDEQHRRRHRARLGQHPQAPDPAHGGKTDRQQGDDQQGPDDQIEELRGAREARDAPVAQVVEDAVDHGQRPDRSDRAEEAPLRLLQSVGGAIAPHHPHAHQRRAGDIERQFLRRGQRRTGDHVEHRRQVHGEGQPGEAGRGAGGGADRSGRRWPVPARSAQAGRAWAAPRSWADRPGRSARSRRRPHVSAVTHHKQATRDRRSDHGRPSARRPSPSCEAGPGGCS